MSGDLTARRVAHPDNATAGTTPTMTALRTMTHSRLPDIIIDLSLPTGSLGSTLNHLPIIWVRPVLRQSAKATLAIMSGLITICLSRCAR